MKKTIAILAFLMFASPCLTMAQPGPGPSEKVKQWKIAYLTERLNLTVEEAKSFWPLFDKYEEELDALKNKYNITHKLKPKELALLTDIEVEKRLQQLMDYKQAMVTLQKRYIEEFKKIISNRKVLVLLEAQEDFKKEMMRKVKGGNPPPPKPR